MDIKKILEEFNNFLGCDGQKEGQTEEDMVTAETAIEEKGEEAEKADMEQAEYKEIEPKKVEEETIAKNLLEEFSKLKEFYDVEPDQNLEMEIVSFGIQDGLERFELDGIEFFKGEDETLENAIDVCVDEEFFPEWESENGIVSYSIDKIDYDEEEGKGKAIVTVFGDLDESLNEVHDKYFPKDELSNKVKDALSCLFNLDDEGNTYITAEDFIQYIEDLKQEDVELLDDIKLELGADFDKLLNKTLPTLTFINESLNEDMDLLSKDATFRYMMLDRLRMDCGYFLGNGNRNEKRLWAGNVEEQIQLMKDLYNSFEEKPEWISMEEIERYEKQMKQTDEAMNEISDELASAVVDKRQADAMKAELEAKKAVKKAQKANKLYNRWKKSKNEAEGINPSDIHCILAKELPAEDLDHHASDLYVRKTEKSTEIINKLNNKALLTTFIDNIEGKEWYELPFCYNPECGEQNEKK